MSVCDWMLATGLIVGALYIMIVVLLDDGSEDE